MTTTGSTLFNLDFTEIAEEAWERAGREMRSGYDLRTARRSMNLMTIEWQNKGINMWTMEQGFINLVPGLATYALPVDTIDLLEQVIRTGQNAASTQADLTITRISVSTYATIPNKLQQARPIQVWIQRLSGQVNPHRLTFRWRFKCHGYHYYVRYRIWFGWIRLHPVRCRRYLLHVHYWDCSRRCVSWSEQHNGCFSFNGYGCICAATPCGNGLAYS